MSQAQRIAAAPAPLVLAERYELGRERTPAVASRVFDGVDRVVGRLVTIELSLPGDATHPAAWAAARVTRVDHPNVVAVLDAGVEGTTGYVVTEYTDGPTLDARTRNGPPLHPGEAVAAGRHILQALAAAHREDVVHGDLTAENVILSPRGATVARFAWPARRGAHASARTLAPEVLEGRPPSARSDVYSAGALLYELLAGRPPFPYTSSLRLALAHPREEPTQLNDLKPDLDPALVTAVHRALAKRPQDRFPDAGAFLVAALDAHRPARPPSAAQPAEPGATVLRLIAPVRIPEATPDTGPGATEELGSGGARGAAQPRAVRSPKRRSPGRRRRGVLVAVGAVVLLGGALAGVLLLSPVEQREVANAPSAPPVDPGLDPRPAAREPLPEDLPDLIGHLAGQPEELSTEAEALLDRLRELDRLQGEPRRDEAVALSADIAQAGQSEALDPAVADAAGEILEPLTLPTDLESLVGYLGEDPLAHGPGGPLLLVRLRSLESLEGASRRAEAAGLLNLVTTGAAEGRFTSDFAFLASDVLQPLLATGTQK